MSVLSVEGPFREPREPVFSYDYVVLRAKWPTPQAVRIKVSIPDELDYLRSKVLGVTGGSPGQQLLVTRVLTRRIADSKLDIADREGLVSERLDVMLEPFTKHLGHLFSKLEAWMKESRDALREEIRQRVGL